jgi:hypothetical protein
MDLGSPPLTIDVAPGQVAEVEIHRDGYKPQKKTLDGSQQKVTLKLDKIPGARPRSGSGARPATASDPARPAGAAIGGSEIVNPWGR